MNCDTFVKLRKISWPVWEYMVRSMYIIWGTLIKRKYQGATKLIHGLYDTPYQDCLEAAVAQWFRCQPVI